VRVLPPLHRPELSPVFAAGCAGNIAVPQLHLLYRVRSFRLRARPLRYASLMRPPVKHSVEQTAKTSGPTTWITSFSSCSCSSSSTSLWLHQKTGKERPTTNGTRDHTQPHNDLGWSCRWEVGEWVSKRALSLSLSVWRSSWRSNIRW
jgi:hypothetical protein